MDNKTYNGLQEAKYYITELIPKEEQGRYHKEIFDAIDSATRMLEAQSDRYTHMKKLPVRECLEHFASIDVKAYEDDGSVYAETSAKGVYVQISTAEVYFRAEEN